MRVKTTLVYSLLICWSGFFIGNALGLVRATADFMTLMAGLIGVLAAVGNGRVEPIAGAPGEDELKRIRAQQHLDALDSIEDLEAELGYELTDSSEERQRLLAIASPEVLEEADTQVEWCSRCGRRLDDGHWHSGPELGTGSWNRQVSVPERADDTERWDDETIECTCPMRSRQLAYSLKPVDDCPRHGGWMVL